MTRRNTLADFEAQLDRSGDCWVWTGRMFTSGYGRFHAGQQWRAHRYAYEAYIGPIGEMHVLHRCDNPPCCNPAHLFLGTPADNAADKAAKERTGKERRRGERNGNSRLTASAVRHILTSGAPGGVLARELGVSRAVVNMVRRREIWSHVHV